MSERYTMQYNHYTHEDEVYDREEDVSIPLYTAAQRMNTLTARVAQLEAACKYALRMIAAHQVYDKGVQSKLEAALDTAGKEGQE